MRRLLPLLLLAFLAACATHNSHTVRLRPREELVPLVDEAVTCMQAEFARPLPSERVALRAAVEPVVVRWLLPAEALDPSKLPARADLQLFLLEVLRQRVPEFEPEHADYVVSVVLELDLHDPDELGLRVACELSTTADGGRNVADGSSTCLRLPRLYCHGCRDRWSGLGTHISAPESAACVGGSYPVYLPICSPSPGYFKH